MRLDIISKLSNDYERVCYELTAWYEDEIRPLVNACTSLEELDAIWREIGFACLDPDGQFRDLPGTLHVEKCFAYDALRQKLNG